jgi:hypothetical protein
MDVSDGAGEKRVGRDGKARRPPQQSCRRTPRQKDKAPAPNYTMAKAQVAFSNCVVDILGQLGSPRRECEFIAWAHTNLTDIAAKRGNAIQALAAESVDEDDNEAEIKQQVAAAKRDLIQRLEPHLDALEQGVALLRGEREDHAQQYGVKPATFKEMVAAKIKAKEKKDKEAKAEQQRVEARASGTRTMRNSKPYANSCDGPTTMPRSSSKRPRKCPRDSSTARGTIGNCC